MDPLTKKRSRQSDETVGSSDNILESTDKLPCKYGNECYRKNPEHFQKFSHPGNKHLIGVKLNLYIYILDDGKSTPDNSQDDLPPKKLLKTKSSDASYMENIDHAKFPCPPFYVTKVAGIADTHNAPDVAIGIKGKPNICASDIQ